MTMTDETPRGPSVWGPGDPHKTWDDLVAEAPAGGQNANPMVTEMAAKDDEITRLKAELAAVNEPLKVDATVTDITPPAPGAPQV